MNGAHIKRAMRELCALDADIARAFRKIGPPRARLRPQGFETFLQTIVSQQVSTAAASSIYARVEQALDYDISAVSLLACGEKCLRAAGMSQRKCEYATGLARAIVDGDFRIEGLAEMELQDAIDTITRLRGFGRWSAEIYCMFSLRHRDVFPADDLALLNALVGLKHLKSRPSATKARELTAHWAPFRSSGALFLWHFYHHQRAG